jgi:hypothetical protein
MKRTSFLAIWWLAGTLSAGELPEITVRLQPYVEVSTATLQKATETAGEVLRQAGIRVVWAECPPARDLSELPAACSEPVTPATLQVRIVGQEMARRAGRKADCMGYALLGGEFSSVAAAYFHRALDLERGTAAGRGAILGGILAHELGHLLGVTRHAGAGLMKGSWEEADLRGLAKGQLGFSRGDSQRIGQNAIRRVEASGGQRAPR